MYHGGDMKQFRRGLIGAITLTVVMAANAHSLRLEYQNNIGRKYRIKNIIIQDIFLNGQFHSSREAMNKATLEVVETNRQTGKVTGKYYYYTRNINYNESFHLHNVYQTEFLRDKWGGMTISDQYLMPTSRNIPLFITNDLKPGDTWKATGEEIHEGIIDTRNWFKFPIEANYKYLGLVTNEGRVLAHILIDYHIMHFPRAHAELYSITGFSYNNYYWDIAAGSPYSYQDTFSFMVTLVNGETVLYKGRSQAIVEEVTDVTPLNKQEMISQISNTVSSDTGTTVKETEDGIIVNLGHILFDINKADLKPDTFKTLDKVIDFLRKYPHLDIEISGHTDNTGQNPFNQVLSENRAKSVADYFILKGLSSNRISYQGFGPDRPVSSNLTPEGRALNRRVEIKIITRE